jgi:hypothetical protein
MAENKMAQVAQMIGKQLGEEFYLKRMDAIYKAKFTDDGLELYDSLLYESLFGRWAVVSEALNDILTGWAEIVGDEE